MKKFALVCLTVGLISAGHSEAALTLNFSEKPFVPVDGLYCKGITFGFTVGGVSSTDAYYHAYGPGTTKFVDDPSLEGNAAGVLTLDFKPQPVDRLQFGVALGAYVPLTPGFTVRLFDMNLTSLKVAQVNALPLSSYTEGQFTYRGPPIRQAVIDFEDSAGRFALDHLTFHPTRPFISVPSPGALLLGSMGVALVSWLRRTRTL